MVDQQTIDKIVNAKPVFENKEEWEQYRREWKKSMKKNKIIHVCDLCGVKEEGGGDTWRPIGWTEMQVKKHGELKTMHICPRCRIIPKLYKIINS